MNKKTIIENIETLASENMTEDGIHHDDWPDRSWEYELEILKDLNEHYEEVEEMPQMKGTLESLNKLKI